MDMVKHRSWSGVRLLIAVLMVGLAVLPAVTRVAAQDSQTATVGVAFTLTGNAAVYGQSQQKGAELARKRSTPAATSRA